MAADWQATPQRALQTSDSRTTLHLTPFLRSTRTCLHGTMHILHACTYRILHGPRMPVLGAKRGMCLRPR